MMQKEFNSNNSNQPPTNFSNKDSSKICIPFWAHINCDHDTNHELTCEQTIKNYSKLERQFVFDIQMHYSLNGIKISFSKFRINPFYWYIDNSQNNCYWSWKNMYIYFENANLNYSIVDESIKLFKEFKKYIELNNAKIKIYKIEKRR